MTLEPSCLDPTGTGRRPISIERTLPINSLQHWFHLSDPAAIEALYGSRAMCCFVGIDLSEEPVPDETTIWNFRHLMKKHNRGDQMCHLVNQHLDEQGMKNNRGTIVAASII